MPPEQAAATTVERPVSRYIEDNRAYIESELGFGKSYDVIIKDVSLDGKEAFLAAIDGFFQGQILNDVIRFLMGLHREDLGPVTVERLMARRISYIEGERTNSLEKVVRQVLAGFTALFIDGEEEAILIEVRAYPGRMPEEPSLEKVLRGPRDGFTETLLFNTALIRRRLRDPRLRLEVLPVGRRSRTDVCVAYIEDIADPGLVSDVKKKIKRISVDGLPMAEKSLEEFLTGRVKWWNPFPVVRYTERPDIAAQHLLEGHVVVLVDTSPVAVVLPTTMFHHVQHAEEFHQDVTIGTFFRFIRWVALAIAWFGTPVWLALATSPEILPKALKFIGPKQPGTVPLVVQFFLAELGTELIRMSLIHTPTGLTTSLGIIGAVLMGELAIKVGLFSPEVVLYSAISALAFFATPSHELAAAVRLMRFALLILVGIWKLPGLAVGLLANFILLLRTRSFGVPYLWPLIPFDAQALVHVLLRQPVPLMKDRFEMTGLRDKSRR